MKLLKIDSDYFLFPEGIRSVADFVKIVNCSKQYFMEMTLLDEGHCVAPYFIEEDKKKVYINFDQVRTIEEVDGKVMLRVEYERCLRELVKKKCADCVHFVGDFDDMSGHVERLRLDGHCWGYEKQEA